MKQVLLIAFGILYIQAIAQQTVITGKVRDKRTGEAVIGAVITIGDGKEGTVTDYEGEFILKTTKPFPIALTVNMMGYEKITITVKDNKPIELKLTEKVAELATVEIRDSRITQKQKQTPLTIESMDAVSIKETPAANFYEGLAHLKGVDITSASIGFKIINTRGFNSTSPVRSLQLIDGIDNQSPGLNFSLGNFLGASELDINRVDLIVGASGAYYGPNAFNGVINMQTKSPFLYPGLSVFAKVGERSLYEGGFRWAQVFKDKAGKDRFAYKLNMYWMQARDWEATNYDPTLQSPVDEKNPGGYDAVNRYGDEYSSNRFKQSGLVYIGYGYALRRGYEEIDLVDYNTRNLKTNASFHYKTLKDVEIIAGTSFSNGTTVYQGDNRFSLKDIMFFQHKAEIRKENKFFVRAYMTHEDAGNSYDAYNTALILQNSSKTDANWATTYSENWNKYIFGRMNALRPPIGSQPPGVNYQDYANQYFYNNYYDSLVQWHQLVRDSTDFGKPHPQRGGIDHFLPGTARFDSAFQAVTSRTNREGGSRFYDRSALYHIMGEYKFTLNTFDFTVGGNMRLYAPNSQGTIFLDTSESLRIYNKEYGAYGGVEKKWKLVNSEKVILKGVAAGLLTGYLIGLVDLLVSGKNAGIPTNISIGGLQVPTLLLPALGGGLIGLGAKKQGDIKATFSLRTDKNQNFNWLFSPAATVVYTKKEHVFRISASSAIRNPTLSDQYINLDVGRATLLGNLSGFDSLVKTQSIINAFNNNNDRSQLEYFNVAPIKPEQVKTIEFGYRTTLGKKLFIDANYYYSWYTNFIGYQIGADIDWPAASPFVNSINVYRVATNATTQVTTQGFTIGANYFWQKYLGFNANYSWNVLNLQENRDSLIPAFNTPEHKYNIGISGRNIDSRIGGLSIYNWGYSINYKWQEGFLFEGSPQFTGFVPAYSMVDAQINKKQEKWNCTFKLGASNLLNNQAIQVYGGPRVGRLVYFSILYEPKF